MTTPKNSSVYTFYMSLDEAQHALSIVEQVHFLRLIEKHYDHSQTPIGVLFTTGEDNAPASVIRGAYVREMAQCAHCFSALTAARRAHTACGITVMVPAPLVEELAVETETTGQKTTVGFHPYLTKPSVRAQETPDDDD